MVDDVDREDVEPLSPEEVARFTQQVGSIAEAGLPLAPGLRATAEEMPGGRLRSILLQMADALEGGVSLNDELSVVGDRLPAHLRGLIVAGSKTGRLGPILGQFVGFMNVGQELRRQLWLSLSYPVIATLLAFGLFGFVSATIVSSFENIFKDFGVPLPAMTLAFLGVARVMALGWKPLIELPIVALVLYLGARFLLSASQRRSLLTSIPVIGQVWWNTALAEFCHLLALLVESNVPLPEATRLTGDGVGDARLSRAGKELADEVERGSTLSHAMARVGVFPRGLPRLVHWAEQGQNLPGSLHMAGEMLQARARTQARFAGTVLSVMTVISVVAGVSWMVLALFLPLISLISRLSG